MAGNNTINAQQIIVNVSDTIPPENLATIDKGSLIGNAVSKEQFQNQFDAMSDEIDEKFDELKDQVEANFKGVLKPTDAAPMEDGSYKPAVSSEDDKPTDPNSTADWGKVYPNAGNLRAKTGYDTMFYKKGAVWSKAETKFTSFKIKTTFDKTDNQNPSADKAISNWLGVDDTIVQKTFGSTLAGGSTSPVNTGGMITNSTCKATKKTIVKSIITNASTGGDFKIAVTNSSNVVTYTSASTYTAGVGSQTTVISDLTINADDTLWLLSISGSTLVLKYSGSGGTGNFVQRNPSGVITNGPNTSYYSLAFNVEEISNDGILNNYIKKSEANGYDNIDPLETFGDLAYTTAFGNQANIGYYLLKIPFTADKTILQIDVRANSGTMNFAIGSLDQADKFIEEKVFSKNLVAGVNNIVVDEYLEKGKYLAIKTPGLLPYLNTSIANNYLWVVDGSYTNPLMPGTSYSLAIDVRVKTRVTNANALAKKSDIAKLQSQIDNFQVSDVRTSPDGTKWKMSVSNEGKTVWTATGRYTKILHFGNSILKHAIVSYWWGFWGMAAKTRNDDYAHRFLAKIKVANPTAQSWEENIAIWEQNPASFNKASLDSILTAQAYDLVVIRLGENATSNNPASFKTEFRNLINYIQTKVPTARIIIGGMFWMNGGIENAMSEIATEKNLTFASMSGLDVAANKSFIGDTVQGDDGQTHTVDNAGVANHPNNAGMEAIATRLFNAAQS